MSPSSAATRAATQVALFAVGMCGLCACKTLESSAETQLEVPGEFTASRSIGPKAATGWLDDIRDRKLASLVDEAMRYNNDLAASAARLKAARANVQIATAPLLPQLGTDARASRRKMVREEVVQPPAPTPAPTRVAPAATTTTMGTTTRPMVSATSTPTPMAPLPQPVTRVVDEYAENYDIGANLSWEIDLWGKLINRRRASSAELRAASADHHAFKLTLAANVARAWFNAAEAELQVQLSQSTVESLEKNLRFVDRGVDLGTSEPLDFRLTRANLENARGNLEARKRQRDQIARSLEALLGRYPANLIRTRDQIPGISRAVPAGLPSELLLRRPDIIAAEQRLLAAGERVNASKKEFLPSFTLTANSGIGSEELRKLLNAQYLAWSIAANAAQPIFQGGRLTGNLKRSKAQYDEAMSGFRERALQAFREVETALAAEVFFARQVAAQERAVDDSLSAEKLAWQQFSNGLIDALTWLEAQRRSFNSRSALLQARNLRLQNRIDLYLALGGDFKTKPKREPVKEKR